MNEPPKHFSRRYVQCARLLLRELGIQPSVDTSLDYVTPLVMLLHYVHRYDRRRG